MNEFGTTNDAMIDTTLPPAWEALFDAIEDGVAVQSLTGQIIRVNTAFAAMLGLPPEAIVGRTCIEVFGCGNLEQRPRICARQACESTGRVGTEELPGRLPGQRLRSRVSPIPGADGKPIAFVMVVRDITDVVAHERELARVEQLARFGELAAGLAHEIKNPLAGIQGAVDILIQRRAEHDPEREVLTGVRREVARIDATVHALLDRARPREFNFQIASLTDAVQRACNLARHQAARLRTGTGQQIEIQFIPTAQPIHLVLDAAQIEDAVLNLILNALEAIEGDGTITVRLNDSHMNANGHSEAVVEVQDTGHGISAENLTRIFSPFFTTHVNGTGLGLPAVRRIVRAHGGRVEVSSTVGVGTTFTIHLPRNFNR